MGSLNAISRCAIVSPDHSNLLSVFFYLNQVPVDIAYWSIGLYRCPIRAQPEEKQTNVKRENKLYSYKEQMAELEIRKVQRVYFESYFN